MTFTSWLPLFLICLLGAMSPGPSFIVVSKHTLAGGRKHGLVTSWAHAAGIGFYALLSILGLAILLEKSPVLFKTVSYAGALYLIYLGYLALTSKSGVVASLSKAKSTTLLESAREGILISLLSPKIALFFLAIFSPFVTDPDVFTFNDKMLITLTPFVVDGIWYSLVTFLLSMPFWLDKIKSKALCIDRASGAILILLALKILTQ